MIAKAAMCNQKYISLQKQNAPRVCINTISYQTNNDCTVSSTKYINRCAMNYPVKTKCKRKQQSIPVYFDWRPEIQHCEGEGHVTKCKSLAHERDDLIQDAHAVRMLEVRPYVTTDLQTTPSRVNT